MTWRHCLIWMTGSVEPFLCNILSCVGSTLCHQPIQKNKQKATLNWQWHQIYSKIFCTAAEPSSTCIRWAAQHCVHAFCRLLQTWFHSDQLHWRFCCIPEPLQGLKWTPIFQPSVLFFLALAQLVKCCIHNSGVVEQVVVLLCLPLKRWEQQIVQLIGCILPADRLHLTWLFILNPVVCPCTLINMNTHHPGGYDVHTIPHLLLVVFTWLATAMCVDHVNCISIFSRLTFVFLHHHLLNLCQDDFCFVDTACKD